MATSAKSGSAKTAKRRPVFSKRYWPVQVAVFEFENDERLNHSIELTRTFRRDGDSEWETTPYLTAQDLLPAAKLLGEAYSVIQSRIQKEFAERNGAAAADEGQSF
jgi:hypothetical protein